MREVAREHAAQSAAQSAAQRSDGLPNLPTRLIGETQMVRVVVRVVVCVELLVVTHLLRNPPLAQAISAVGWGEVVRQLE